jgi:hypothetical protein
MQVVELPGHDGRTGLWTRHSVGALEAERDLRRQHREARTIVYHAVPHAPTAVSA